MRALSRVKLYRPLPKCLTATCPKPNFILEHRLVWTRSFSSSAKGVPRGEGSTVALQPSSAALQLNAQQMALEDVQTKLDLGDLFTAKVRALMRRHLKTFTSDNGLNRQEVRLKLKPFLKSSAVQGFSAYEKKDIVKGVFGDQDVLDLLLPVFQQFLDASRPKKKVLYDPDLAWLADLTQPHVWYHLSFSSILLLRICLYSHIRSSSITNRSSSTEGVVQLLPTLSTALLVVLKPLRLRKRLRDY
jgi:hypothetical protein